MSFNTGVSPIESNVGGKLLQIMFSKGITSQVNREFAEFNNILMKMMAPDAAREYRFQMLTGLDFSRVKWQNQGTSGKSFAAAQGVTLNEVTAKLKQIQSTLKVEYDVWKLIKASPEKYADIMEVEVQAALDVNKIELARRLFGDGSGVLAQLSASVAPTVSSGVATVTVSALTAARGFIGNIQETDILKFSSSAGAAHEWNANSSGILTVLVTGVDRDNNTFTCTGIEGTITAAGEVAVGDMVYLANQVTVNDLTATQTDYNLSSEVMVGLESLAAADARVVHGVTMSGTTSGSRIDYSAAALDGMAIEKLMNKLSLRNGDSKYKYNQLLTAPEVHSYLVDMHGADRKFIAVNDNVHGLSGFAYQHRNNQLMLVNSRFCPKTRVWAIPSSAAAGESGENGFALEFRGQQFEQVDLDGQTVFFKPATTANSYSVEQYFIGHGNLIARQPAALGCIENFSIS